jgi:hypothetical protein
MKPLPLVVALFLLSPSLFAAADLKVSVESGARTIRAGFNYTGVIISVRNDGPDTATAVKLDVRSSIPIICTSCDDIGPIPARETRNRFIEIDAPATPTTFTVTATATSSAVADPNPADNTASLTLTVSTDPDIQLSLGAPQVQDLGLPFDLFVTTANFSKTTAHDVDVTLDFNPQIGVRTLPPGCSNPAPGQILCHQDEIVPTGTSLKFAFKIALVAPESQSLGSIVISGRATEREHDFDPSSNNARATIQLYRTVYVTSTANDGSGSLRRAILDAAGVCAGSNNPPCTIAFRIAEPSATPWKTIRITSPLPIGFAPHLRIEGATQTGFFGDTNPDGPEIEISGGGTIDGDGLTVTSCGDQVGNLAVNGFRGNGIAVIDGLGVFECNQTFGSELHHLYLGTDPTGVEARPNGRGIGIAVSNVLTTIHDSVISGNTHSGIFGLSGRLGVSRSRIGVQAHSDAPLPNGNTGIYVGPGAGGSDIGANFFQTSSGAPDNNGNVIAFNGQMGVAVASNADDVSIRNNRIWGNGGLAIDVGLDGPTPAFRVPQPVLTLAHYDPVAKQTVIEGDVAKPAVFSFDSHIDFFASDAPALSGAGEAQRPLGHASVPPGHFRFTVDGDLTGQFVTATATRVHFVGFAVIGEGIDQGFLTATSELSRPIEVR